MADASLSVDPNSEIFRMLFILNGSPGHPYYYGRLALEKCETVMFMSVLYCPRFCGCRPRMRSGTGETVQRSVPQTGDRRNEGDPQYQAHFYSITYDHTMLTRAYAASPPSCESQAPSTPSIFCAVFPSNLKFARCSSSRYVKIDATGCRRRLRARPFGHSRRCHDPDSEVLTKMVDACAQLARAKSRMLPALHRTPRMKTVVKTVLHGI